MLRKKEWLVIGLAFVIFASLLGAAEIKKVYTENKQIVQPGQVLTGQDAWVVIDATTSTGTEPTDLAVTERTYATVIAAIATAASGDDEISVYGDGTTGTPSEVQVVESWNGVRFRCIGITDGGAITYQIYAGTLDGGTDCELSKVGQLAFTIGTQVSTTSTYELADAVVVTANDWAKSWGYASPGSNQVAEAAIDLMGADLIVAVCTAANCDTKLIAKGF